MPRDAKLGFVVGVALVILIAVIFYQSTRTAGAAGSLQTSPEGPSPKTTSLQPSVVPGVPSTLASPRRSHTVREGETLSSLAARYYGDASWSSLLFRANRSQLTAPDRLPVGTVLLIPDLPAREDEP
jgi:nucleoid-associated protein YgaU